MRQPAEPESPRHSSLPLRAIENARAARDVEPIRRAARPRNMRPMSILQDSLKTPAPVAALSHQDIRRVFYGLMLGGFLSAVNQTIVASALPTIGRELGDFHNLSWVIIAYLLSSTVVAPLYGKLSDIHGRRAMMLAAIGLFIAGSAVSAAAPG